MSSVAPQGWLSTHEGHIKAQLRLLQAGVFEVASIGKFTGTPEEIEALRPLVDAIPNLKGCRPFATRAGNTVSVMIAAHPWGAALVEWLASAGGTDKAHSDARRCIMAMLMGYAPEAIHEKMLGYDWLLPSQQEDAT
jgi:hypothetical protein